MPFDKNAEVSGVVIDDPVFKNDDYRFGINTQYGDIYIMLPENEGIARSNRIALRGKIQSGFGNYVAFMYQPTVLSVERPSTPD